MRPRTRGLSLDRQKRLDDFALGLAKVVTPRDGVLADNVMHLEPGVEAALQECQVQELLEPSPHLNAAMEAGITHPKIKIFGNSTDV